MSVEKFIKTYNYLENDSRLSDVTVSLAGRIIFKRNSSNVSFITILSNGTTLQVLGNPLEYKNKESFDEINKLIKRGDIIGVIGSPGKSIRGEISIIPFSIVLLAPCMKLISENSLNLPYLSMINDNQFRNNFLFKSKMINLIRDHFDGYDEIETPILIRNGPESSPFYLEFENSRFHLKNSSLSYFKQLTIGGFTNMFEISKSFESDSEKPEYSVCQFSNTQFNLEDCLDDCLNLFKQFSYQKNIQFTVKKIDVFKTLEDKLKITIGDFSEKTKLKLDSLVKKFEIECFPPKSMENIINSVSIFNSKLQLIEEFIYSIERENKELTILYNFPNVYPTSRESSLNSLLSEKFEFLNQNNVLFQCFNVNKQSGEKYEEFGFLPMIFGQIFLDRICFIFTNWV
jgi:lysyl-tRNA synthetase, class II